MVRSFRLEGCTGRPWPAPLNNTRQARLGAVWQQVGHKVFEVQTGTNAQGAGWGADPGGALYERYWGQLVRMMRSEATSLVFVVR